MSAITAKASRKMKKYAVLTREPRCFLGSFDLSWEQRKAIDIADYSKGNGYSKGDLTDAGTPIILYGRLYTKYQFAISEVDTFAVPRNGAVYSQGNEVIVPASGETAEDIARASAVEKSGVLLGGDLNILRPFDFINPLFLALAISNGEPQKELAKKAQGKSVVHIHNTDIQEVTIAYPSRTEQDRIVSVFRQLDNLITLHQRKCALLFSPFQAFISMMFITSTFSWEQREVGDLLIERSQQAPMSDEYPLMAFIANEGVAPKGERYDRSALVTDTVNKLYKKTEKGDFIYSSNNLETGSIGLNKYGKACISPVYSIFEPTGIADSDFLGRRLVRKDFINAMVKWRQGVIYGQWRIHESDFLKIEISVPSVEEQRKIGAYLDQLDNLITLHQRKCIFFTGRAGRLISTVNKKRITSSWEQRKLGDMMNVTSVKRIHQSDWTDSGVRFLRARDIVAAAKNEEPDDYLYISKEKYEEYSTLSGKVGVSDLLVTGVGTIGVPYLVRNLEPLYFKDGNIIWFQNSDKIDGKFLFYSFSAEQIQGFINESAGIGTVGTYTIESGKKTPISLPNQIEQAKVGEFFQQLDNLITLHQRKPFLMKWRTSDANRNQTNRLVL